MCIDSVRGQGGRFGRSHGERHACLVRYRGEARDDGEPPLPPPLSGLVVDYEVFDRYVFEEDLERVRAFYRAHGFYEAQVRAGRVEYVGKSHVRVTIVVEEGELTLVKDVALKGLAGLPPDVVRAAESASVAKLRKGVRFNDDDYSSTEDDIRRALTYNGYAYAKTSRRAEIDSSQGTLHSSRMTSSQVRRRRSAK